MSCTGKGAGASFRNVSLFESYVVRISIQRKSKEKSEKSWMNSILGITSYTQRAEVLWVHLYCVRIASPVILTINTYIEASMDEKFWTLWQAGNE